MIVELENSNEVCKFCGTPAKYYFTYSKNFCCSKSINSCPYQKLLQSKLHKGKPTWNAGLTKGTDDRILKQASQVKQHYQQHSGTFLGKSHTAEAKFRISRSKLGNRFANRRIDRQNYYNQIRMDSKWEIGVAIYLTKNQFNWKYSEFGYKLEDGRYYFPDFFIYENFQLIKLIEVKGYFRPENKFKYDLFLSNYPDIPIEIWDNKVLRNLGIIDHSGYLLPTYTVTGSGPDCKSGD